MKRKIINLLHLLIVSNIIFFPTFALSSETLPQFFGLYLRTGEQIIELQAGTVEGGGLSSLTRIAVSSPTPSLILYHDQHSPHDLQLTQLQYTFRVEEQEKWRPTESTSLKIAPVEGKQYMYLLAPGEPLSDGVYADHFGGLSVQGTGLKSQAYDFVVGDPEQVVDLTVHRTKAKVYAEKRETWDQAIAEYQQALSIIPEDTAHQEKLALLYYQKQDYQAAIEEFQRLLTLAPETPEVQEKLLEAYLELGRAAMQEKNHLSALEHLAQVLPLAEQINPEKLAVIAGLQAEIYYQQEDFDQAFKAAQKASEKGALSSKPYVILAFLYLRQGDQKEALKFLDQAAQKGLGNDMGGHLLVNTGYGNLTIPVKDVASVSSESVTLKTGEMFKGEVQLKIE